MKQVILPIHPEYVAKILTGEKTFEYRKKVPIDVTHVLIYETSPISKIVAIGEVAEVLFGEKNNIWKQTSYSGGIKKDFFDEYFEKKENAYAIRFRNIYKLPDFLDISNFGMKTAPQSYIKLSDYDINSIMDSQNKIIMKNSLIFVGGVHGVGKTTFCQNIISPFGYSLVSASTLIKIGNGIVKKNKIIEKNKIEDNQNILCLGASNFCNNQYKAVIDGHFCLITENGKIEKIGIEVFKKLNPSLMILLETSEQQIRRNILKRDGKEPDYSVLDFLKQEREYAYEISKIIGKPLYIFDSLDHPKKNKEKLKNILSGENK
ncbi:AAA family ATPase [Treponema sp.]|uniref:AAA family ATPase n=1 Tax=Treponema sp. TaxID=166 RepID=UPI003FD6E611